MYDSYTFKILDMSQHIGRVNDAMINRPNWHSQVSACCWGADVYVQQSVTKYSITIYTCDQMPGTHTATILLCQQFTHAHTSRFMSSSDSTLKTCNSYAHRCWECRWCSLFTSVVKVCMIGLWTQILLWWKKTILWYQLYDPYVGS